MTRICVLCKNFYFETAEAGYSEMTPGSDASMGCYKGLVEFDFWRDETETYRQKMLTAVNCPEFDPAQEYLDYLARGGQ